MSTITTVALSDIVNYAYIYEWALIAALVLCSGLFSGLNLGLMGLDPIGLQIVMASDNAKNRKCAEKLQPLRKHGNWLLCTLLIGNVAVNAGLSILLADKTGDSVGFFVSTAVITVFGEIIPQALCSRYALQIGASTAWLVKPLMWISAIITYPIAFLLDQILGDELGTIYSNKELQKLVEIHAQIEGTGVSDDTAGMLKGALSLKDAKVSDCMTEMKDVFWLNDQSKLSFDVLTEIFKSGHSRIPIFNTQDKFGRITCVGLLYVKDLILLDPKDKMPVTQIMNAFKYEPPPIISKNDTLQHLLEIFIKESQHLAFVQEIARSVVDHSENEHELNVDDEEMYEYVGIITLEDVIECVLQTEVIDEHDNFIDNKQKIATNRLNRINWSLLKLFDHHRASVSSNLRPQELQAVFLFLSQTVKQFMPSERSCSEASLKNLLAASSISTVIVPKEKDKKAKSWSKSAENRHSSTSIHKGRLIEDNGLLLYQKGQKTKYFTLILDGKCEIFSGSQGFRSEMTRWSYLCADALDYIAGANGNPMNYVPDFTAKVIEDSRILRIKLDDFKACLEGKLTEPISKQDFTETSSRTFSSYYGNTHTFSFEIEDVDEKHGHDKHLGLPNKKKSASSRTLKQLLSLKRTSKRRKRRRDRNMLFIGKPSPLPSPSASITNNANHNSLNDGKVESPRAIHSIAGVDNCNKKVDRSESRSLPNDKVYGNSKQNKRKGNHKDKEAENATVPLMNGDNNPNSLGIGILYT